MASNLPALFSLEGSLARARHRMGDILARVAQGGRVDVSGLPQGAMALALSRTFEGAGRPTLVITPDTDTARKMAADLRFFAGSSDEDTAGGGIFAFPASDTTAYADVAPDRRATMERLAVLFHLASGSPWRFLVVAAPALLRRLPPRAAVASRSLLVKAEGELDRDALVRVLSEGGYLRVPVVEDPGTFAVRGNLIDVYVPHAATPARIELDDYLVLSIKHFDPEDQRTIREARSLSVHPVRDMLAGEDELTRARERLRALCDSVNMPSTRTRQLLDDVESGRAFLGVEGLLPAFYDELDTLFDYLAPDVEVAVVDPVKTWDAITREREEASGDRGARVQSGAPTYPVEALYLEDDDLSPLGTRERMLVFHALAVSGAPTEEEAGPLEALATVDPDTLLELGGEDHSGLTSELKAQRAKHGKSDALAPLAARTRAWLDAGLRVVFAARTMTQAERLASLLRGYDLPVSTAFGPFDPASLTRPPPGQAELVVGPLNGGFVLPTEALACVTEEEVFGGRAHKRAANKRKRDATQPFLEDLRQLAVGDYIVHSDHGIGRYVGLERKPMALSKAEEMRGAKPGFVEVLVVEYAGGDKLFLPVTRLNQIQKFSGGEGATPKMDRLGGQTFSRTKQKVERAVQALADDLLKLYAQRAALKRDPISASDRTYSEFEATFPFDETPDQLKAIDDVLADLEKTTPMDRIVCGDVGFGKTEVALRAAFRVALTGRQVAILCPTTVLAQQHFNNMVDRMRDWPLELAVLSRFVDKAEQTKTLAKLKEGKVDIVVGTHRLLSKDVHFKNLGLLVVDEEQRFGVTHKERIKQLRAEVDVLTLSATPIPRTLQLAVGGMRDLSLITTPPADRRSIRTIVARWDDHLIKEAISRELLRGGQVFFVYNRIEGLYERANRLQQLVPNARFAVAHGQMAEGPLEQVMTDFVDGRADVLCATAIVESGLDIPRANTILIDRADLFGLAQLYQLRGRVGRAKERAYCYLLTPPPNAMTDEARARIEALQRFTELGSGFQVASLDMELRGAGDLLGAEQSGNIASVGFDLFVHMLQDAVAQLRGEPVVHEVDTELTIDVEHYLPEQYVDDVGLRLSLYKRFAGAEDIERVDELAVEMEDRFGKPPEPALRFIRAMRLKPPLRALRVLGCEATRERVTLHLREDTPLDPQKVLALVALPKSPYRLSPDMKLTCRFAPELQGDAIDRVETLLRELEQAKKDA